MGYAPVVSSRTILWVFAPILLACDTGPIVWGEAKELDGPPAWKREAAPVGAPALPATACPGSARYATNTDGRVFAVWWSVRADSSAEIVSAAAKDPRAWETPVRLDSADVGKTGCRRPAPEIAVDGDNVHLVYAMIAREGPGIFSSHSMDRGATFHSPVAVVYGEKPGLASVAARGNFVVVAYEDPNTSPTRISLAVSTTMAHLFEYREIVSPPGRAAASPHVVTAGESLLVVWVPAPADSAKTRFNRSGKVR